MKGYAMRGLMTGFSGAVIGTMVGVIATGLLMNFGADLPIVSEARKGFRTF
jgi:uncharacterized membrane protein